MSMNNVFASTNIVICPSGVFDQYGHHLGVVQKVNIEMNTSNAVIATVVFSNPILQSNPPPFRQVSILEVTTPVTEPNRNLTDPDNEDRDLTDAQHGLM